MRVTNEGDEIMVTNQWDSRRCQGSATRHPYLVTRISSPVSRHPYLVTLLGLLRDAFPWPIAVTIAVALACVAAGAGAQTVKPISVWSGVYTAAQNKRGEELHSAVCAMCHGPQLNGAGQSEMPPSPAIARATFLRKWSGQTVAALFIYVRQTMPPDAPGTLTDQQAADAIAHMFAVSNMPAGNRELPLDLKALASIMIEAQR